MNRFIIISTADSVLSETPLALVKLLWNALPPLPKAAEDTATNGFHCSLQMIEPPSERREQRRIVKPTLVGERHRRAAMINLEDF